MPTEKLFDVEAPRWRSCGISEVGTVEDSSFEAIEELYQNYHLTGTKPELTDELKSAGWTQIHLLAYAIVRRASALMNTYSTENFENLFYCSVDGSRSLFYTVLEHLVANDFRAELWADEVVRDKFFMRADDPKSIPKFYVDHVQSRVGRQQELAMSPTHGAGDNVGRQIARLLALFNRLDAEGFADTTDSIFTTATVEEYISHLQNKALELSRLIQGLSDSLKEKDVIERARILLPYIQTLASIKTRLENLSKVREEFSNTLAQYASLREEMLNTVNARKLLPLNLDVLELLKSLFTHPQGQNLWNRLYLADLGHSSYWLTHAAESNDFGSGLPEAKIADQEQINVEGEQHTWSGFGYNLIMFNETIKALTTWYRAMKETIEPWMKSSQPASDAVQDCSPDGTNRMLAHYSRVSGISTGEETSVVDRRPVLEKTPRFTVWN